MKYNKNKFFSLIMVLTVMFSACFPSGVAYADDSPGRGPTKEEADQAFGEVGLNLLGRSSNHRIGGERGSGHRLGTVKNRDQKPSIAYFGRRIITHLENMGEDYNTYWDGFRFKIVPEVLDAIAFVTSGLSESDLEEVVDEEYVDIPDYGSLGYLYLGSFEDYSVSGRGDSARYPVRQIDLTSHADDLTLNFGETLTYIIVPKSSSFDNHVLKGDAPSGSKSYYNSFVSELFVPGFVYKSGITRSERQRTDSSIYNDSTPDKSSRDSFNSGMNKDNMIAFTVGGIMADEHFVPYNYGLYPLIPDSISFSIRPDPTYNGSSHLFEYDVYIRKNEYEYPGIHLEDPPQPFAVETNPVKHFGSFIHNEYKNKTYNQVFNNITKEYPNNFDISHDLGDKDRAGSFDDYNIPAHVVGTKIEDNYEGFLDEFFKRLRKFDFGNTGSGSSPGAEEGFFSGLTDWWEGLFSPSESGEGWLSKVLGFFSGFWDALWGFLEMLFNLIVPTPEQFESLGSSLSSSMDSLKDKFSGALAIGDSFSSIFDGNNSPDKSNPSGHTVSVNYMGDELDLINVDKILSFGLHVRPVLTGFFVLSTFIDIYKRFGGSGDVIDL